MRIVTFCLASLLSILFSFSCNQDDLTELYKEDRSNLVGNWNVTEDVTTYSNGVQAATYTTSLNLMLNEDGSGILNNLSFNYTDNIKWIYQLYPQEVIFTTMHDFEIDKTFTFDVLYFTKDSISLISTPNMPEQIESYEHINVRLWELYK